MKMELHQNDRKSGNNDHLFRRYPAQGGGGGSLDDPRSIEEHCKGMCEELKKASLETMYYYPY